MPSKSHHVLPPTDRGSLTLVILVVILICAVIAAATLFVSTEKVKTSSNYAACQRALNNADAGADRVFFELIHTPDTNNDGVYDDTLPIVRDAWGTNIYDIDGNGLNDFTQLYAKNKNIPDVPNVSEANKVGLFITSNDEAYVWVQANSPSPNQATIYSQATSAGCTKRIKVIVAAVAGSKGSGVTSPLFNAP